MGDSEENGILVSKDLTEVMTPNSSSGPSLNELNSEEARKYYGFVVFIGAIFLPAVIGNSHIIHIYIVKKKHNNTRVYVLFIAVLDMINCLVCYPFNIVNCLRPFTFYNDVTCRVFMFITYFVNICVPLSLLVVSVDRYRVICYPFGAKIPLRLSKALCVIAFVFSVIISIPSLLMIGSVPIETRITGVYGRECNLSDEFGSLTVVYIGVLSVLSVIEAIALIVLYSLMGFAIRKQEKLLKSSKIDFKSDPPEKQDTSEDKMESKTFKDRNTKTLPRSFRPSCPTEEDIQIYTIKHHTAMDNTHNEKTIECKLSCPSKQTVAIQDVYVKNLQPEVNKAHDSDQYKDESPSPAVKLNTKSRLLTLKQELNISSRSNSVLRKKTDSFRNISNFFKRKKSSIRKKKELEKEKENFKRTKRVTIMFFWITFIYVVSFLPNPALRVVRYFKPEFYFNMSLAEQIIYHLVIGSVFLVSATNFFIYLFCDSMFRREINNWYRRVFCWCRQKC